MNPAEGLSVLVILCYYVWYIILLTCYSKFSH